MKKILEMADGGGQNKQPTDQKSITGDIADYTLAKPTTRYIPSKIKKQIISKTNGKCSYPNCNKPAEILHHAERFAASHNHDSLTLLCKIHHEFAHNNLIKNETQKSCEWRISSIKQPTAKISQADILYKKYRQEALAWNSLSQI